MREDRILSALKRRGVVLDDWQEKVYNSDARQICMRTGRQVGKTTIVAAKAIKNALETPGHIVLIISRAHRQSSYLFNMVLDLVHEMKIKLPRNNVTQTKLIFPNSSRVYSLPSGNSAEGIRGMTVHTLIIDEAAYVPDEVFVACEPMLATTKGQLIILSTPCGPEGFFYKACHSEEFDNYYVPSTKCHRIPEDWLNRKRKSMSSVEFRREYLGEFVELAEGMIEIDLIMKQTIQIKDWKPDKDAIYFLGVDVARFGKDDSVLALCEYKKEIAYIVWVEILKGRRRITDLAGRILHLTKTFPIKKIIVDETGVGGGCVDMLVEQLGNRKVLGVNNAARSLDREVEGRRRKIIKEDMYSNLITMLEQGKLFLADDLNILRSLRQVRVEYTHKGNVLIFGADHDIAEAIVRSLFPFILAKPKRLYAIGIGEKHFMSDNSLIEW